MPRLQLLVSAILLVLLVRPSAPAMAGQIYTWDGGSAVDSNWMTAANWVGDIVPIAGNGLTFPGGAARPTNNNNFPAGSGFQIHFTGTGGAIP